MKFKIDISVDVVGRNGSLEWDHEDLKDRERLLDRLLAELQSLSQGLDWEVIKNQDSPFWGLNLLGDSCFGSGAQGRIGDRDRVKGWLDESLVILIGEKRGLPRHHVQLLQGQSFGLLVKDPLEFAMVADPEELIQDHLGWNLWVEGVRDRENF